MVAFPVGGILGDKRREWKDPGGKDVVKWRRFSRKKGHMNVAGQAALTRVLLAFF
jgi:hypothetical protein